MLRIEYSEPNNLSKLLFIFKNTCKSCHDHLPFGIKIATIINFGIIVLLNLPSVLMKLLVIDIGLNLIHNLLRSRSRPELSLSQLLHRSGVNHMGVAVGCKVVVQGAHRVLSIDYRLGLGLSLCLGNLKVQTLDLVHQCRNVWIRSTTRYDLGTHLLKCITARCSEGRAQCGRLAHDLSSSMHMVELSDVSGHVVVTVSTMTCRYPCLLLAITQYGSLNATISHRISVTSIGSPRPLIELTAQLLSAQPKQTTACVGIGYRWHLLRSDSTHSLPRPIRSSLPIPVPSRLLLLRQQVLLVLELSCFDVLWVQQLLLLLLLLGRWLHFRDL